jgi:acylphosphatase
MSNSYCQRFVISGLVQGVFFRKSTQDTAKNLKLNGSVRNLDTGEVEVIACGTEDAIQKLAEWLWKGPPQAQVQLVLSFDSPKLVFNDFSIIN